MQSNFKTTQSYVGDKTKQQNVSRWPQSGTGSIGLSCCGYRRKPGQQTQSPSSSLLLAALPRQLEKPQWRETGMSPPGPGGDDGHSGAEPRLMLGRAALFPHGEPRASRLCRGGCRGSAPSVAAPTQARGEDNGK